MSESWGSDTPVSMPTPVVSTSIHHEMGDGWAIGQWGLIPAITITDFDEFVTPTWSPQLRGLDG